MAARGALEQGQGVGVAVGGQGGHEGGQLGAVPALPAPAGGLVVAHGPRQLGPVHAHGQGEQALVGDRRAGEELVVVAVGALLHYMEGLLIGGIELAPGNSEDYM